MAHPGCSTPSRCAMTAASLSCVRKISILTPCKNKMTHGRTASASFPQRKESEVERHRLNRARAHCCWCDRRAAQGEEPLARFHLAGGGGARWNSRSRAMDTAYRSGGYDPILRRRYRHRVIPDGDRELPQQSCLERTLI